ncbi:MAG: hypothetical protein ACOYXC_20215 [Candidatus Rifleibacteriota bacterium]
MKASKLVRTNGKNGFCGLIMAIVFLMVFQAVIVSAQETNGNDDHEKNAWQGKKGDELTFDDDTGTGNGHEDGKLGKRVGHSDDMPGKRLGHRKGENGEPGIFEDNDSSVKPPNNRTGDAGEEGQKEPRRPRRPGNGEQRIDNDDNAPGRRGGPGTNWENLPGKRGGRGTSPDCHRPRRFDNDDNAPGRRGGPGTNWENLPGKRGGPGTSPDRAKQSCNDGQSKKGFFRHRRPGNNQSDQSSGTENGYQSQTESRKGKNNGSNGLHIGNRKNNAGNGIKNYTGNNPGRGRGKNR